MSYLVVGVKLFVHIVCKFFVEIETKQSHCNFMTFAAFYGKSNIIPSCHPGLTGLKKIRDEAIL